MNPHIFSRFIFQILWELICTERVDVRKGTGGDAPHMIVQGDKHGRVSTRYTGTKELGGTKKSTRLTSKYVLRG